MKFLGRMAPSRQCIPIGALVLAASLLGLLLAPAPPAQAERLYPSDLTYQGAFRLPDNFNWGARGMTYYPEGNGGAGSLLIIGNDNNQAEFGEVAIPTPARSADWQSLPQATLLGSMTNFDGNVVESVWPEDPGTVMASGIEYVPAQGSQTSAKLYGSVDQWYGVSEESHPTIWFSELNGSNPRGPWHVGPRALPFHGNKAGDFLFSAPYWYAEAYLGGRFLITGKNRGAFNGSQGPSLIAFQPWTTENPSGDLNAVMMIYYRINEACASPNVCNKSLCDYPGYTFCDKWEGGAFVESGQKYAVMLLGSKGLGNNDYGPPANPDMCMPYQGYHCDPFERQIIFYDVQELAQATMGTRDPWSVVPYEIWRPSEFLSRNSQGYSCGETGGMALDRTGKRLFVTEKGLGDDNSAVVHCWSFP